MNETEDGIPLKYGDFGNRMLATTIDLGLLFMIALPVVDIIVKQFFAPIDTTPLMAAVNSPELQTNPPRYIAALLQALREQHVIERMVVDNLLQIAFIALYILPFWFRFSSTPGKMLFRLEIRDDETGALMSRRQAVVRFLGYFVSAIPLSLGFVWMLINKKRRCFHDLIAGTVVVVRPKSKRKQSPPPKSGEAELQQDSANKPF